MNPLVECVPNFSEGRDEDKIKMITNVVEKDPNVTLLDVDMGFDFNRTVVTMVGNPESVLNTVIECTKIASQIIDMSEHTGEHARMGAVDVVPFIPIRDITMDDCIQLSKRYAKVISNELDIGVYLYAKSARIADRIKLPDIRRGEYEGLPDKLSKAEWKPDYGPAVFNSKLGVTATGARQFLIAFNINLNTNDKVKANSIASKIRTSGHLIKDKEGNKIIDSEGKPKRNPGLFDSLQAAGWMYNDDIAQVSMNFLDYSITGLHTVTEEVKKQATLLGLEATSSELVGLVPLEALIDSGRYYSKSDDLTEEEYVNIAIEGLMLNKLNKFDPKSNIIEWAISGGDKYE